MSKCLIVYFSQNGTTASVAARIAVGLRAEGFSVDLHNLQDVKAPDPGGYDLLGVGSPTYVFRPPFVVLDYLRDLPVLNGLPAFAFLLYGTHPGDAGTMIRRKLSQRGAREVGYYRALGVDRYLGYLKLGYLFSPGHPMPAELDQAEQFAHEVAARSTGALYEPPDEDPPPGIVYRLERFLWSRLLVQQVFSRTFQAAPDKCNRCGLCTTLCPSQNIKLDKDGWPTWGRGCLMCLSCEMGCPEDAISWLEGWPFWPLIRYNIRHALADPGLTHMRVIHQRGRTERFGL